MQITIALAKGRLAKLSQDILEKCGVDTRDIDEKSRKLVFYDTAHNIRFLLVKPSDVPVYVNHGIADIGIVGKDTLLEAGLPLYEMLDLQIAACCLCVIGYKEKKSSLITQNMLRVATKYPSITQRYYDKKGESIEIIELNGSIELAPVLGLSDVILDIVESGRTLKENGLSVLEEVCRVSARLVVNQVSLKTKSEAITPLIDRMSKVLEEASS